jgi:RNA polymerase sigma-70 factor, ECF subfamily
MARAPSERWREAAARWPGVALSDEAFSAYLTERASASEAHDADLFLACACAKGDGAALAAFEDAFFPEVDVVLARVKGTAPAPDELRQLLRHRLFVGPEKRIVEYSGRGSLKAWFRITASRLALNVAIRAGRERPIESDALEFLVGGGDDPELAYLKGTYGDAFRSAFREAFHGLERRDRNLLRYAFREGLSVQAIGTIYDVHGATAARWVKTALDRLSARVRQTLRAHLGISEREYDAILRLIESHLHLSLERYMQTEGR